jgi:hypothetical protein
MSLFKDTLEHLNAYFAKENMPIEAIEKVEPRTPEKLLAFSADRENEENKLEKFEDITLADGVTVITVEPAVEVGSAIVVVTEEGVIPAPVNTEYELADGRVIKVGDTEGMIAEIIEVASTDDEEGTPAVDEEMGDSNAQVKRLIERIESVKEFTTEKEEALAKENKFLHEEIALLKDENLANKKRQEAFEKVVHNTFKVILGQPEKAPAVKQKNPLAKEEKPNMFHSIGAVNND